MGPSYRRSARFSNKQPTQGESALGLRARLGHVSSALETHPCIATMVGCRQLRTV
jgi:hypothetical protein